MGFQTRPSFDKLAKLGVTGVGDEFVVANRPLPYGFNHDEDGNPTSRVTPVGEKVPSEIPRHRLRQLYNARKIDPIALVDEFAKRKALRIAALAAVTVGAVQFHTDGTVTAIETKPGVITTVADIDDADDVDTEADADVIEEDEPVEVAGDDPPMPVMQTQAQVIPAPAPPASRRRNR